MSRFLYANAHVKSFHDIADFPKLQWLTEHWQFIRDELALLNAPIMPINRVNKSHDDVFREVAHYVGQGNKYGWIFGWGRHGANKDWLQFPLIYGDAPVPFLNGEMRQTVALLAQFQGIKVCALLKMNSHSSLPCHDHPELAREGLLQFHLPLKTAATRNYNYLNVNGEFRQHVCGEPIVFDGSHDHFALNESDEERVLLYMEFSAGQLTER
jgi:beta-hydroxylase